MGEDQQPLLGGNSAKEGEYGSFARKEGYSASPKGLAGIVSESQLGALKAYGGAEGLLAVIAPSATTIRLVHLSFPDNSDAIRLLSSCRFDCCPFDTVLFQIEALTHRCSPSRGVCASRRAPG